MSLERRAKLCILLLVDEFQRVCRVSDVQLSKEIYGNASFIKRLRNGDTRSFSLRKYDEIVTWFEECWPDTAIWPPGVDRIDRFSDEETALIKRKQWEPWRSG